MTQIAINAALWQAQNLEHLRYEYDLKPDDLVIDIGAYKGEWAKEIFARYGCKLICIEPTEAIQGFNLGQVINKAAGTKDGWIKLGGVGDQVSAFAEGEQEFPCFDVNTLLDRYDEVALVKINIEGAEYELLNHIIDAGMVKRIKNVQVQFHLIDDQPIEEMYGAIASKLEQTHSLTWHYPFCWENWRRNE